VKGVINMRVSSVDSLLTNNNITIDEQIKFCNNKNSSQEGFSDENEMLSKADIEHQRFMNLLEKQVLKVDKKIRTESFFKYVKTPDEITSFSNYLISHLKKIDPYEEMLLFYFLQTVICYLTKCAKEEECNLEELVISAVFMKKDTTKEYIDDSFFDIVIKDELCKSNDNSLLNLRLYYERFCKIRTENASRIILKNLIKIVKKYKPYEPKN
jgi:hypothetical protein